MADNKKILICWNDTAYIKNIKIAEYDIKLFTSKDSLNTIAQSAEYMVVLCELLWSHEEDTSHYSELNGIKLAQYLRREKEIKIPILFVSFLSQEIILDIQPDAEIINTPALKHGFIQLPLNTTEWEKELSKMKGEMSDLDLIYTKRRFCGIIGLLEQINHDISSCWTKEALNDKLRKLQYADKNINFSFKQGFESLQIQINSLKNEANNKEKTNEIFVAVHDKFKELCQEIKSRIQNEGEKDAKTNPQQKKYNVLFLDDEYSEGAVKDNRIKELIDAMKQQGFHVTGINTPEYNQKKIYEGGKNGNKYDAVICDIEIWEKKDEVKELICLGYNYIQYLSENTNISTYIILSNVTRSLHHNIINNLKTLIHTFSKSDVLSSDSTRQVFIDGIRNLIEQKRANGMPTIKSENDKNNYKIILKELAKYIGCYSIKINKDSKTETYNPNNIEDYIEKQCEILINIFIDRYDNSGTIKEKLLADKTKGLGEELSRLDVKKTATNTKYLDSTKINDNIIDKFIKTLIVRRLLIYVILKYNPQNIQNIFSKAKDKLPLKDKLLFPTTITKDKIWNDSKNKIQDNCANFLTEHEISYIEKIMKNKENKISI